MFRLRRSMKWGHRLNHFLRILFLLFVGQSVPSGIRYHTAPAEVNARAHGELSQLLDAKSSDLPGVIDSVTAKTVLCGPSLWHDLQPVAPVALKNAAPTTFAVPSKIGTLRFEGRRFKTPEEKSAFFEMLLSRYLRGTPTIRKASGPELSYYWAWAAWDLREPLFIATSGGHKMIFNFFVDKGTPRLFMVDLVGSVHGEQ